MAFKLTQKEQQLLGDQLNHEKVCIQKYSSYAQQVRDPQLKQMFNQYASEEQNHYDTVSQLLSGQPANLGMSAGQGRQQGQFQRQGGEAAGLQGNVGAAGMTNQEDATILGDMLMTEKFVSGAYDTAVFESANSDVRQALQHIQKEEQQHGEGIFNYMSQHGMYNPK
ncbi:MAG: spore coat protein [Bacillota bacterium]